MKSSIAIDYTNQPAQISTTELFLLAIPTLITIIISFLIQNHALNADVGLIIHETYQLLAGGNYVTSFFETNPPLILYLTVPVAFIAELFSLNPIHVAYCYFSIMALVSVLVSYDFLTRLVREPLIRYITFLSLLFINFLLPLYDFGEREHLAIILTIPYFFAAALALQNKPLSRAGAFFIGLTAGLGFALKPYFLIPLCMVELVFVMQKQRILGWVRIESLTILSLMVIYLAVVWYFHPAYLHVIVPLVKRYYFLSIALPWSEIYLNKLYGFCVATLIASFFFYKHSRYPNIIILLSLGQMGYMLALLCTHTDWYYHMLPALAFSLLQITFCLAGVVSTWIREYKIKFTSEFVAVMVVYFSYFLFLLSGKPILSENLLLTLKWLLLLGISTAAALVVYNNRKIALFILCWLAIIFYFSGSNTLKPEYDLLAGEGYYIFLIDFISIWMAVNILICVLGLTKLKLAWVPTLQKLCCFSFLIAIVYFYPLYKMNFKYNRQQYYFSIKHQLARYLEQFSKRGGIFCFSCIDPGVCVPISFDLKRELVNRQPSFWWARGLVKSPVTPQRERDKLYLTNIIANDINQNKPQWIIINPGDFINFKNGFNLLNFLSSNKNFKNAWSHYVFRTTVPMSNAHYRVVDFYVYERK